MSNSVISVYNVSKMYNLLNKVEEEDKFLFRSVFKGMKKKSVKEFWALKDIDFEIKKGEKLGIIGRNGAGKSTLLKILSRIVAPTTGKIEYEGRIASLLEVGTGFHPELSGRENIYLNGSILGMSKTEIKSKFDQIVSFAEVENFLDTPVKRYSSGMYVRLAFAVAAHLETEILIVDEVLAVGDAAFQKKCLGKMNDISKSEGKTILFVSHSMQAVQKICDTGIFLKNGKLVEKNSIDKIVNSYLQSGESGQAIYNIPVPAEPLGAYTQKVFIESNDGEILYEIPVGSDWRVRVEFKVVKPLEHFILGLGLVSSFDLPIRTSWSTPEKMDIGEYEMIFENSDLMLTTGIYKLIVGLSENERTFQYIDDLISIQVSDAGSVAYNNRIVNTQSGLILNPMPVYKRKLN